VELTVMTCGRRSQSIAISHAPFVARESGLANNTLAAEYVGQLSDLLAVVPSYQWDADKGVPLQRRPAKFHFVNLSVALAFSPNRMTQVGDLDALEVDDGAQSMGRSRFTSCPPVPGVARSSRPQAGAHCDHVQEGSTRIGTVQAAQVNA
jgi:hypothetical protein